MSDFVANCKDCQFNYLYGDNGCKLTHISIENAHCENYIKSPDYEVRKLIMELRTETRDMVTKLKRENKLK